MLDERIKIQKFLKEELGINLDRTVHTYLSNAMHSIAEGKPIRGALASVGNSPQVVHGSVYKLIREVNDSKEYKEMFGSSYPVSPNEFLTKLWEKYLFREE